MPKFYGQNKQRRNPRYFLHEDLENEAGEFTEPGWSQRDYENFINFLRAKTDPNITPGHMAEWSITDMELWEPLYRRWKSQGCVDKTAGGYEPGSRGSPVTTNECLKTEYELAKLTNQAGPAMVDFESFVANSMSARNNIR